MPQRIFSFNVNDFVLVWLSLIYEALPFIVVGSLLSGIIAACVSRETIARALPKNRWLALALSAVLGLAFPMCECGIVPVMRRLVMKGVPVSCAIAYMLSAPIINPVVLAGTLLAFSGQGLVGVTLLRAALGFVIAVAVGAVVWLVVGEHVIMLPRYESARLGGYVETLAAQADAAPGERRRRPVLQVLSQILVVGSHDFFEIGAYLVLGAAVAAVINSGFYRTAMDPLAKNWVGSVAGMMVLAVLLNLCSEADAFVAASFRVFSIPAKLSFLVLGPMVDIKLLLMYTRIFRPAAIMLISGLVTLLVFVLCVTGHLWMPQVVDALPQ